MDETQPDPHLRQYVERSVGTGPLATRVETVMRQLPLAVRSGLLDDPAFRLALDDFVPGRGRTVWMACPTAQSGSRCVTLKPSLADGPEDFSHYIIAHELAHAHLRNGGWDNITDPEHAADALAKSWGFTRPPHAAPSTP